MQELISAANVAGLFNHRCFGQRAVDEWTMLVVLEVQRTGEENSFTAEFLDSRDGETRTFTCRSEIPVLEADDYINMKGMRFPSFTRKRLGQVMFRKGEEPVRTMQLQIGRDRALKTLMASKRLFGHHLFASC